MKTILEAKWDRRKFILQSMKTAAVTSAIVSGVLPLPAAASHPIITGALNPDREEIAGLLDLARRSECDFAEVFFEQRWIRRFRMTNNRLIGAQLELSEGTGIRAAKGRRIVHASVDGFEKKPIKDSFRWVVGSFDRTDSRRQVPELTERPIYPRGVIFTLKNPENVQNSERLKIIRHAIDSARNASNLISEVDVSYEEDLRRILVANTDGVYSWDYQPTIYFTVNALAQQGKNRHRGMRRMSNRGGFELFDDDAVLRLSSDAVEEAVQMMNAVPASAGRYPVVLASGWGGVLFHEAVGHGLEADAFANNSSYYCGKLGQQVAASSVTLVDAGNYPRARGSSHIDDEGTLTQSTVLIENGVLQRLMTDRIHAGILNMPMTGNARRQSYREPPIVRMTNTFIKPGPQSPESIVADTPQGIYCRSFNGGMVDTASGNFTFSVREAYWIRSGRIHEPVRGAILIGQGSDVLMQIDRIADDFELSPGTCGKGQWVPVTSGQPTIRIASITVGGTAS